MQMQKLISLLISKNSNDAWNVFDNHFMCSTCVGEHDSHKTISLSRFLTFLYAIEKTQQKSFKYFHIWEKKKLLGTN